ncbi:hypothetical protein TNCT_297351 [Trichonephila clavata]|uniref:Uncharacterized protein n=1 Tax=Trichonephila clavata TaxID=2740835 RepID=A0A8X6JZQ0_TRICU|nr:hypothetical protein TNCT_297351 [Trichonephila clavata]
MLKWVLFASVAVIFFTSGVICDKGNYKNGPNTDGPIGDSLSKIMNCVSENGKDLINGMKGKKQFLLLLS